MVGLTPESKLVKGVKASHSPQIKGRFWLLQRNVIMANDPFYKPIYDIQKEYYCHRPDLLLDKIGRCPHVDKDGKPEHPKFTNGMGKGVKTLKDENGDRYVEGWLAYMDNKARSWLNKLLISHAVEIIVVAEGKYKFPRHHDYIHIRSTDMVKNLSTIDMFKESRAILLQMQQKSWKENGEILRTKGIIN